MPRFQVRETNLRKAVRMHGVSVQALSRALGVKDRTIQKFLRGEKDPDVFEAILLADILLVKDLRSLWNVTVLEGVEEEQ